MTTTHLAEIAAEQQLLAYNARALEPFLSNFTEDVEVFEFPATLLYQGKATMRERYTLRFADEKLHCVIVKRMVMGNTVIDQERVRMTLPEGPGVLEAIVIYEAREDKIAKITFIPGKKTPGEEL
ncbi:nuclear transport factor 2 family protein [Undibacterium sp. SXout11W]|uniref:nuclear transport factor 2 family protein n=1 Tax=Undibacterium TaxID=401469 RepID=UPI003BF38BB9